MNNVRYGLAELGTITLISFINEKGDFCIYREYEDGLHPTEPEDIAQLSEAIQQLYHLDQEQI